MYYVTNSDYIIAMNAQQEVNLSLIERFAKEKIEFAFPTQTLYVTESTTESTNA